MSSRPWTLETFFCCCCWILIYFWTRPLKLCSRDCAAYINSPGAAKLPLVCAYLQPLLLAPTHVEKGPSHKLFLILWSDQSFFSTWLWISLKSFYITTIKAGATKHSVFVFWVHQLNMHSPINGICCKLCHLSIAMPSLNYNLSFFYFYHYYYLHIWVLLKL